MVDLTQILHATSTPYHKQNGQKSQCKL